MTDTLVQRDRCFNKRIFELTENGLRGRHKGLFYSNEYFVDYDDIGTKVIKETTGRNGWLAAATIALVLATFLYGRRLLGADVGNGAEIFYLLISVVCGTVFALTYKRKFYLVKAGNENAIDFLYNNPSKKELEDFINRLRKRRSEVLEDKYGQINHRLSYEQNYNNLMWLLNNDVIGKEEFDRRKAELSLKFSSAHGRQIGFSLGEN